MNTNDFVAKCRKVATLVEEYAAGMDVLDVFGLNTMTTIVARDKAQFAELLRRFPGHKDKHAIGESFWVTCHVDGIVFSLDPPSRDEVCERRVVGQRMVRKAIVVQPAVTEMKDVAEDIVEWDCGSLLNPKQ